jgi:predicted DNA-binding transcriptional regulator AlpA
MQPNLNAARKAVQTTLAANENQIPPTRRATLTGQLSVLVPRGLQREAAAGYVGISATKFDQLVSDGRMPKPRCIDNRKVWDRFDVDAAFAELPSDGHQNPWDEMVS